MDIASIETDSLIVFGGETNSGVLADLWVLNNVTDTGVGHSWGKVSFSGSRPSARYGHRAVYNEENSRMIIWGGLVDPVGGIIEEDDRLWVLTNANGVNGEPAWVDLTEDGVRPKHRAGFSAVYDSANNRMIVFGGADISGDETVLLNDIWVLTNADGSGDTSPAWQEITPSDGNIPYGRALHSAVYDASSNRMIITGGRTAKGVSSDIWILTNANGLGGHPHGSRWLLKGARYLQERGTRQHIILRPTGWSFLVVLVRIKLFWMIYGYWKMPMEWMK